MPSTIKQIAERSGMSIQTVSKILNDQGEAYRPETRQKIVSIARELGYRPNSSAKAMRSGKFGCVALLLSMDSRKSLLPVPLLEGIQDALAARDLNLMLARLPDEKLENAMVVPKILREWMADGLLINYNADIPSGLVTLIEQNAVPAIWINSRQSNDCVYPDDFQAGRSATEHLIEMGHSRIAFFTWHTSHYSGSERIRGYQEAMRASNLDPQVADPVVPDENRANAAFDWLSRPDRPTAIVAYSDHVALPVLYAAASLHLRVPEDLSIVTFDAQRNTMLGRPIDTMILPERAMGASAVDLLLKKIADPTCKLPPHALESTLECGGTCRRNELLPSNSRC